MLHNFSLEGFKIAALGQKVLWFRRIVLILPIDGVVSGTRLPCLVFIHNSLYNSLFETIS